MRRTIIGSVRQYTPLYGISGSTSTNLPFSTESIRRSSVYDMNDLIEKRAEGYWADQDYNWNYTVVKCSLNGVHSGSVIDKSKLNRQPILLGTSQCINCIISRWSRKPVSIIFGFFTFQYGYRTIHGRGMVVSRTIC
jgi:hypothetical protein